MLDWYSGDYWSLCVGHRLGEVSHSISRGEMSDPDGEVIALATSQSKDK